MEYHLDTEFANCLKFDIQAPDRKIPGRVCKNCIFAIRKTNSHAKNAVFALQNGFENSLLKIFRSAGGSL